MSSRFAWPAILFSLLFILLFAGEYLCGLVIDLNRGFRLLMYRVVVWDFMATLYALLEGVICILAARFYLKLKERAATNTVHAPGRGFGANAVIWGVVAGFLALFCFFEYMAVNTALDHHLSSQGILNMARFYRIVTGWFWTTFEGAVAVILIKIYLLMRAGKGVGYGGV